MRAMKNCGIPWIGEIPEAWNVRRLRFLCDIQTGNMDTQNNNPEGAYPFYVRSPIVERSDNYTFDNEAVLMAGDGVGAGKVFHYVKGKYGCHQRVYSMAPLSGVNGKFLYYYLQNNFYKKIEESNAKSTVDSVRLPMIKDFPVSLPEGNEQSYIADYLDDKCSKIDETVARQEQIIEKLQGYKTAIITEATTHGLNTDVNRKTSSIGWVGEIPEHWSEFRIANLYNQTSEAGNENLPILTVSINTGISDRELSDEESDRVFVRSEDRSKYERVQPGDLAYNMMRAWQGAFGAARVEGMVSPAYVTCRPKENANIDSRYIEYLFRTPIAIEEMHRFSHGVADFRLRLYWPEFKNIRLCLPPIKEQKEIADYIDKKSVEIEREITSRKLLIEKLAEYKKSLIYEVVTGKKEV